ncbi:MAG: glycoside hydrolase family 31 protein [Planctomycetota bacterium]
MNRACYAAVTMTALVAMVGPGLAARKTFATTAPKVESVRYVSREASAVRLAVILEDGTSVPLKIDVLTPYMVRVRADRDGAFAPTLQENDGFLKTDWSGGDFRVYGKGNHVEIAAAGVTVAVTKSPFRLTFRHQGTVLTETAGIQLGTGDVLFSMESPADEEFYGFCDQGSGAGSPFLHRGEVLTMASLTCHRIYYSPFFMSSRGYGFFLNTLVRSDWDMARRNKDRYTIHYDDPRLDFYVIVGPSFRDILSRYTELTGRPPLPPKWLMGGHVSAQLYAVHSEVYGDRYRNPMTWHSQMEIEESARVVRKQKQPIEIFHIDAAWETDHNSFKWVKEIPEPRQMLELLDQLHFKTRIWQRPTLANNPYPFFQEGVEKDYFVKAPDGKPFICEQHFRGPSAMVDFTNPDAVRWWQEKCRWLVDLGANTFKLDSMSSGWLVPYPEAADMRFHNGLTGKEMDNYYGPLYIKVVWDALREVLNGQRAVLQVMHAMYFAGSKYPYAGLGDRGHYALGTKIRTALNYGLSGVPFWHGGNMGAFSCPPLDEELGNRLHPYTYTYWRKAHETGMPVLRALVLEYQDDPVAARIEDQFLFGESFLVAPVFDRDSGRRRMYLPTGEWIEYGDNKRYLGPAWVTFQVRDGRDPVLVKEGAIIPIGPLMEYTKQKPYDPLTLEIYPGGESSFTLYEDDYETYAYESGEFARTKFRCEEMGDGILLSISAAEGAYDEMVKRRAYQLKVRSVTRPSSITVSGKIFREYDSLSTLKQAGGGWHYNLRQRLLSVQLPPISTSKPVQVRLKGAEPVRFYGT